MPWGGGVHSIATAPVPGRPDWRSVIRHERIGPMSGHAFGQHDYSVK